MDPMYIETPNIFVSLQVHEIFPISNRIRIDMKSFYCGGGA